MAIIGFIISCLLIVVVSRSYWLEPLMVGVITYMTIGATGWHPALMVALSIGVASIIFVVQIISKIGYYLLSALFSALYGYTMVALASSTFESFDRRWAVLTFVVTFLISLILHWARREVLAYGTWVHLY